MKNRSQGKKTEVGPRNSGLGQGPLLVQKPAGQLWVQTLFGGNVQQCGGLCGPCKRKETSVRSVEKIGSRHEKGGDGYKAPDQPTQEWHSQIRNSRTPNTVRAGSNYQTKGVALRNLLSGNFGWIEASSQDYFSPRAKNGASRSKPPLSAFRSSSLRDYVCEDSQRASWWKSWKGVIVVGQEKEDLPPSPHLPPISTFHNYYE